MSFPTFTMRQLLEAGVHFGHQTRRWDPRMRPYIFGSRNGVHILDLTQTVPMLHRALQAGRDVAASGGRVLFVGTKRQAQEPIAQAARRCGQYYVNHRWLGGMLTNWRTISNSIRRLRQLEQELEGDSAGLTKKERLHLTRERDKLERALGGIKDMGGLPDLLFVIDTNKEAIAVAEANKLGVPVIAVVDSNADPTDITYPIPGNDDASRAVHLYCDLVAQAVLDGIQAEMAASGADVGGAVEPPEAIEGLADGEDQETLAEESAGEEAVPEEAVPEEAVPEEAVPEEAVPEEAAPEEPAIEEPAIEEAADEERPAEPSAER